MGKRMKEEREKMTYAVENAVERDWEGNSRWAKVV